MMQLANEGKSKTEGTRIGLWGASQAIAFGAGGFLKTTLTGHTGLIGDKFALSGTIVRKTGDGGFSLFLR